MRFLVKITKFRFECRNVQLTFVGRPKLVTDMRVNYVTPEKLYLCTNLELPKICIISYRLPQNT